MTYDFWEDLIYLNISIGMSKIDSTQLIVHHSSWDKITNFGVKIRPAIRKIMIFNL